jgi:acyl-CoA synthetase (AMP-forming)/AMP-acid ligase II
VKLFIVLKEGEAATQEELTDYAKTKLATYKLPTEIEFRTELPKSTVGKVLRKELKAEEMAKRKKSERTGHHALNENGENPIAGFSPFSRIRDIRRCP